MFYWMKKKDSTETYEEQYLYIEDDYLYYISQKVAKENEKKEDRGPIVIDLFSKE